MKTFKGIAMAAGLVLLSAASANAGGTVDLRGKQGIPRDLKQYDPPERSLHIRPPPAPEREKPSGGQPQSPPNGTLQGPNNAAPVRPTPIRPMPAPFRPVGR